ncbi:hypothetical protein [Stratiformator vulcanicus]|uniref:Uncharacterized protein n=1 Tax=Stratiformator vulcanicus TaxID=2527980 RepID=A0A517QVK7_9PLAN|nr:hypothetical protein [Stratiformator vulcanicus]QDT35686.1 hypothetical protein Pan189_00390 [Stratiformator vulcanicus]
MADTLIGLREALQAFVEAEQVQSQRHIKPLHRHLVQRLVIEGGFHPQHITPRPPLRIEVTGSGRHRKKILHFDADQARDGEQTVLGGLKTKDVDVVVSLPEIGPVLAISVKGTFNAFRNLTNRMEEAAGDCTNLHIAYPALVYGFLHVMRANRVGDVSKPNDVAINADGTIVDSIQRYHDAMARITNRRDLRNDVSRYEAVALALVNTSGAQVAEVVDIYPLAASPLGFDRFFEALYSMYDLRFVYSAPALARKTRRQIWDNDSPVREIADGVDLILRTGDDES